MIVIDYFTNYNS